MRSTTFSHAFCALVLLGGCVSPDASVQSVDGMRLNVGLDRAYYWASTPTVTAPDRTRVTVEVFPLVDALVVSRADGAALGPDDEAIARAAVEAHCRKRSLGLPSPSSNFADGTWAFYPCA